MARSNTGSTSNFLSNGTAPITAVPFTVSYWVYPANTTSYANCFSLANTGGSTYFCVGFDGNATLSANDRFFVALGDGVAENSALAASNFSANTWQHAGGVFASNTSRTAYFNGVAGTTNTTSRTPTGINGVQVGILDIGVGNFGPLNGRMAEVALWNVALDAADMAALAGGVSPLLVRPASLVAYWPLVGRNSPETDLRGGFPLTMNGTMATADHCRVFYPAGLLEIGVSASGGAVTADSSVTLVGATGSATGALAIQAASSVTLAGATGSATATLALSATGSVTLAGVTGTSTGTVSLSASASPTLDGVTGSSAGTVALVGSASVTLAGATGTSTGTIALSGAVATTFDGVTGTATGALAIVGSASVTLDGVTGTATGGSGIQAASSVTLDGATGASTASLALSATGSTGLDGATGSATATVTLTATATVTFAGATGTSTGIAPITAIASVTLTGVVGTSTGLNGNVVPAPTQVFLVAEEGFTIRVTAVEYPGVSLTAVEYPSVSLSASETDT